MPLPYPGREEACLLVRREAFLEPSQVAEDEASVDSSCGILRVEAASLCDRVQGRLPIARSLGRFGYQGVDGGVIGHEAGAYSAEADGDLPGLRFLQQSTSKRLHPARD